MGRLRQRGTRPWIERFQTHQAHQPLHPLAVHRESLVTQRIADAPRALKRAGQPLNRDVLLVATADEEAGGIYGAGWLIEHQPEIFEGASLLINEGGHGEDKGDARIFGVEVTQKVPVWLRFSAVDKAGHGSMPYANSSVRRVVEALNIVRESPFPPRIVPAVDAMFQGLALSEDEEWAAAYADMATAVRNPDFLQRLQAHSPYLHALTPRHLLAHPHGRIEQDQRRAAGGLG